MSNKPIEIHLPRASIAQRAQYLREIEPSDEIIAAWKMDMKTLEWFMGVCMLIAELSEGK